MRLILGQKAGPRLIGLALVTIIATAVPSPAGAQPALQKTLPPGSTLSIQALPNALDDGTPHRFFTINQVLAKHDAERLAPRITPVSAVVGDVAIEAPVARNPFGVVAFRAPAGLLWTKWLDLETKIAREDELLRRCRVDAETCTREAFRFAALVSKAQVKTGRARLEVVTHSVNGAIRYISDQAQHGLPDRWTSPLATLASGMGDCEDYAILKYRVLREVGVARENLRIVLLRDTLTREAHAVLAAQADGRWFILDNRRLGFYEDKALPHYMPLFALDHEGVKLLAAPYAMRPLHESEQDEEPAAPAARIAGALASATP